MFWEKNEQTIQKKVAAPSDNLIRIHPQLLEQMLQLPKKDIMSFRILIKEFSNNQPEGETIYELKTEQLDVPELTSFISSLLKKAQEPTPAPDVADEQHL